MFGTQNETVNKTEGQSPQAGALQMSHRAARGSRLAFTLTELLIVIAIIAVLAGLITPAVIGAREKANEAAISLELKQIGGALEDFKTEYGAYPPNGMVSNPTSSNGNSLAINDFVKMFKKAFPRSKEPVALIRALAGDVINNTPVQTSGVIGEGMNGAEAIVFWLGGFSKDVAYPISGPGGPSFALNTSAPANGEVLEDRQLRHEFKLDRLGPKNSNGVFDDTVGRFIVYQDPRPNSGGNSRRINLWQFAPEGSQQPAAYFDTSRHQPFEYDLPVFGVGALSGQQNVFALKQFRQGVNANTATGNRDVIFVENKKFQVLHCGTDDIWGDQFAQFHLDRFNNNSYQTVLVAPEGPFIGDIADTLGNFMQGTLEDKQE